MNAFEIKKKRDLDMREEETSLNISGEDMDLMLRHFENCDREIIQNLFERWKSLSQEIEELGGRKINLPEIISEFFI